MTPARRKGEPARAAAKFSLQLLHTTASLYYLEDATQAEIAHKLGVSRPTVSRLLAEARRLGIVRIEVVDVAAEDVDALALEVAEALGLKAVYIAPSTHEARIGAALAPQLSHALRAVPLAPDDVLVVSSGRTVWEAAHAQLPALPGVVVTPGVGGMHEPEAWYQTNEITRLFAEKVGGRPVFLYAPALAAPDLYDQLVSDPGVHRVLELWRKASCAVLGVGAPASARQSLASFVPRDAAWLSEAAGDICNRFFDKEGAPLAFPRSEHMIAASLEALRLIPHTIAVAVGEEKIPSLLAGAHAAWFNTLVTDARTATALLAAPEHHSIEVEKEQG